MTASAPAAETAVPEPNAPVVADDPVAPAERAAAPGSAIADRADRTPTSPQPPARVVAQRDPEPASVYDDDIPLPDGPTDDAPYDDPMGASQPAQVVEQPEPEPEPEAASGLSVADVEARWPDIRAAARGITPVLEVMLSGASIQGVDGQTVVFGHSTEMLVNRLGKEHAGNLRAAVRDVFGPGFDVRVVHATGPAAQSAPQRGPADKQAARPAPKRPSYSRPSRGRDQPGTAAAPPPEPPPEPEEPEPPRSDEELTDAERDEMVADAQTGSPERRLDPDQVALELLKAELGARPLE